MTTRTLPLSFNAIATAFTAIALTVPSAFGQFPAPRLGVKYPGLSNASHPEAQMLGSILSQSSRDLEISVLPWVFNEADPFGSLNVALTAVFDNAKFRRSVTVDIDLTYKCWERFSRSIDAVPSCKSVSGFDWSRFETGNGINQNDTQRDGYLQQNDIFHRVDDLAQWAAQIRSGSLVPKGAGRIHILVTPFLEDDAPNSDAYSHFLDRIARRVAVDDASFAYNRSPNGIAPRIGSLPLELHGGYSTDARYLTRIADTFSPDGTCESWADQERDARSIIANQQVMLYWTWEFNKNPCGENTTTPPSRRGTLTPLLSSYSLQQSLLAAIKQ